MIKTLIRTWKEMYYNISLRNIVWLSFSLTAAAASIIMGLSFYSRFSSQLQSEIQAEDQQLIGQVNKSMGTYLRTIMKVSDTLCYSVIKDKDIRKDEFWESFQLLYDTNKDYIKNIALFSEEGEPIVMAPAATLKENIKVTEKEWFQTAVNKPENLHFSRPHVQNLFEDNEEQYNWVISMSRAVPVTDGSEIKQGILLVDMNYSGLKQIFNNVSLGQKGYLYLMDSEGNIFYHPKQQLLNSGLINENNKTAIQYRDGIYKEEFQGKQRTVTIKSVGYTGWLIAGVTENDFVSLNSIKSNLFILFLFFFFIVVLIYINSYISSKVSRPIRSLEKAVREVALGKLDTDIEIEGFYEVRHLGESVQNMSHQIKRLMEDIVSEHESKRKSELDTLQSQINPHFLYNTLDIIVWMIENERQQDAARAVTALARFFRISLSKGKNIISVEHEAEHVRNYLTIQKMRYKNKFEYFIRVDDDVKQCATIKLILQPLVENAIYHGMEFMDGEGEIYIDAYKKDGILYLIVRDNGLGMTEEKVKSLLNGEVSPSSRGSGIGVANVNERIRLYFGPQYGLNIQSEPDEGTAMIIQLPVADYTQIKEN